MPHEDREERWPRLADHTTIPCNVDAPDRAADAKLELYVYDDAAMIKWPQSRYDEGSDDTWHTAAGLRDLAAAATWAAERLEGRQRNAT
jgi:hypothetical protein